MSLFTDTLEASLQGLALAYDETMLEKCEAYYSCVTEANRHLNLTRITGEAEAAVQHFADSIALAASLAIPPKSRVIDIGTGAGFPGVPLLLFFPGIHMTLMDASGKKIGFVRRSLESIGVKADLLCARAEDAARTPKRESFDIALSRAVAPLSMLLELCTPLLRTGGTLAAWKGESADDELSAASGAMNELGCTLAGRRSVGRGAILLIEKQKPAPDIYPRRFSKIKSEPL